MIMGVMLAKGTDGNTDVRDAYEREHGNAGTGRVEFIGGVPVERGARPAKYVTGGLVRVCGIRIKTRRVRSLDVNGPAGTEWVMEDGSRVAADEYRTVGDWFRFLLDSGSFAGVEYLR
jgi:hypothetical protein